MAKIIGKMLAERMLRSKRAADFLRDFSRATGLPLRFATRLGQEIALDGTLPEPEVCRWMRADSDRCRLCAQTIQEGMLQVGNPTSVSRSCGVTCVAGLREASVPLKMGGELIGHLLVGQVAGRVHDRVSLNRWRHALERVGQRVAPEFLIQISAATPLMDDQQFAAAMRLLEWSASQFVLQMEEHITRPPDVLIPPIHKAIQFIQSHYDEAISLATISAEVNMSREHFCTLFHKSTGLRFIEYLTRIRIEKSAEWLRNSDRPVTEIALACGFQSISQFNRSFRAILGESPREFRKQLVAR
jgi:AraC-like DNA-binding protein